MILAIILMAILMIIGVSILALAKIVKLIGIIASKIIRLIGLSILLQWDSAYKELTCLDIKAEFEDFIEI
jgi:ABC-type cobalamin transport system permease subunit